MLVHFFPILFSLLHIDLQVTPWKITPALHFLSPSNLFPLFLIIIFLFEKINSFWKLIPISSFFNIFISHIGSLLFWLLFFFYLRWFIKVMSFYDFNLLYFFSIRSDPNFFYCCFSKLTSFLDFILSFNIKLVVNWPLWLSLGLIFHELWFWNTNSGLGYSPEFALFFMLLNYGFMLYNSKLI